MRNEQAVWTGPIQHGSLSVVAVQFEEKLLREMLQRSEGADDSVDTEDNATAVDPPSTMALALRANTSRPVASVAAGAAPHPVAAASIFPEAEAA